MLHVVHGTGGPLQDLDTGRGVGGFTMSPDGMRLYVAVGGTRNAVLVYDTSALVP